jgi:Kef-type K+ transport system membrane component KefB
VQDHALLIPLSLLVIFASTKLAAELFERLALPGIVGEIVAGMVVGPHVLNWMSPNQVLEAFSELGLIFLLFRVGLEVKPSEMMKASGTALTVAVFGVVIPFFIGFLILRLWGAPRLESIFVGVAMVATSVGITAEVLNRLGVIDKRASQIILAAAVFDDVLGLLALSFASSLAHGDVRILGLALSAVFALGFTALIVRWGSPVMQNVVPRLRLGLRIPEAEFCSAMAILFGLSALAVVAGVAAIIGAFLAGLAMSESVEPRVHALTKGVAELFLPFFLAGVGMRLDFATFTNRSTLLLALTIILAAIASKLVGCGLGALRLGRKDAIRIGAGMIPRGEVGMVVAQIGVGFGVITQPIYGIIIAMSVVTTLVAPSLLKLAFREKTIPASTAV